MSKEEKEQLKRLKQQWVATVQQTLGEDKFSLMTEPRSYFAGYDADGTRFFTDVSCASPQD